MNEYVKDRLYELLFEVFSQKKSEEDFKQFFISLFSNSERIMLIKRLGLIYLLLKKTEPRNICQLLKISPSTLTKYSLILDKSKNIYEQYEKVIKKEKVVNIFEELLNTLYGPGTPGVDWGEARRTRGLILKRKKYGI